MEKIIRVFVRDNNIDQALKLLKRKLQRDGIFRELRHRRAYEKRSERKAGHASEVIRRPRKLARTVELAKNRKGKLGDDHIGGNNRA